MSKLAHFLSDARAFCVIVGLFAFTLAVQVWDLHQHDPTDLLGFMDREGILKMLMETSILMAMLPFSDWLNTRIDERDLIHGTGMAKDMPLEIRAANIRAWGVVRGCLIVGLALILYVS